MTGAKQVPQITSGDDELTKLGVMAAANAIKIGE